MMMSNATDDVIFSLLPLQLFTAIHGSTSTSSIEDHNRWSEEEEGQCSTAAPTGRYLSLPRGVGGGVGGGGGGGGGGALQRGNEVVRIVMPVFYVVTFVFGLIGNSLTIFVILWNLKKLKSVAICFILNLAVADDLFLASLPFIAYNTLTRNWIFGNAICKFMTASRSINSYVSILTMVVMSIDRYLAIVHPLRSMPFRTARNAAIVCLLLWISSIVILTPYWLYASQNNAIQPSLNLTKFRCSMNWPTSADETIWIHFEIVSSFLLPVLVMIICYARLIRCLLFNPIQLRDHAARKPIRKVTVMVSIVTTMFVVCWAPYHVVIYMNHRQRKYIASRPVSSATSSSASSSAASSSSSSMPTEAEILRQVVLNSVTQALIFVSSCCNPFIYCISSKNFRRLYLKALRGLCQLSGYTRIEACSNNKTTQRYTTTVNETRMSVFIPTSNCSDATHRL